MSSNSNSLHEISSADLIVEGFDLANLVHPVLWRANSLTPRLSRSPRHPI